MPGYGILKSTTRSSRLTGNMTGLSGLSLNEWRWLFDIISVASLFLSSNSSKYSRLIWSFCACSRPSSRKLRIRMSRGWLLRWTCGGVPLIGQFFLCLLCSQLVKTHRNLSLVSFTFGFQVEKCLLNTDMCLHSYQYDLFSCSMLFQELRSMLIDHWKCPILHTTLRLTGLKHGCLAQWLQILLICVSKDRWILFCDECWYAKDSCDITKPTYCLDHTFLLIRPWSKLILDITYEEYAILWRQSPYHNSMNINLLWQSIPQKKKQEDWRSLVMPPRLPSPTAHSIHSLPRSHQASIWFERCWLAGPSASRRGMSCRFRVECCCLHILVEHSPL